MTTDEQYREHLAREQAARTAAEGVRPPVAGAYKEYSEAEGELFAEAGRAEEARREAGEGWRKGRA